MKILLITTGGTIASVIDSGVIDVTDAGRLLVLKKYREQDNDTQFDVISPLNILSENITNADYKVIAETIRGVDYSHYDGIIVTHGSDTLSYTSAMLGLLFSNINIPIAVVAADKSLQDEKSNGMDNFIAAVETIRHFKNGVYVPYKNGDNKVHIHHGVHLFESSVLSDDFYSLYGACATFEDGIIKETHSINAPIHKVDIKSADLSFSKKIMQLCPYPDLNYSRIDVEGIDAVIHRTYHAGSVCTSDNKDNNAGEFIARCQKQNVKFYICGLKSGKAKYESLASLMSSYTKPLYDMTPACAYMKLMLEG